MIRIVLVKILKMLKSSYNINKINGKETKK
jgi:hypothetical protein